MQAFKNLVDVGYILDDPEVCSNLTFDSKSDFTTPRILKEC